ncbi:hypothetical protein ACFO4E_25890 [Nocardiopsis mangrovi]|uniref:ABC transporter permease n=1 Tax=Nocardiopsis mangrovi TaxID=1179818 RepID=A0ABV9E2G2_9ACTN
MATTSASSTATAAAPARRAPAPVRGRPPGFGAALRSEWRKFRALPSNRAILAATAAMTVGITVLMCVFGDTAALAREQAEGEYSVAFFGSYFGIWGFSALAANVVAAEYRCGMISHTLAATPRRWRVLAAKLVIIAVLAFATGVAISFAGFGITQGVLASAGERALDLGAPGMLRAVLLFVPVSMLAQSVLTACTAVLVRSAPAAVVLVIALGTLPVVLARFLDPWWGDTVPRYMAGAAAESVAGLAVPGTPGYLPTLPAVLVIAVWLAVFTAVALTRFARRDA